MQQLKFSKKMAELGGIVRKRRPPKLQLFIGDTSSSADSDTPQNEVSATGIEQNMNPCQGVACSLDDSVQINTDEHKNIKITPANLQVAQHLGRGQYGIVEKYLHPESGLYLAIKRVPIGSDYQRSQLLMDVDVLVKGTECKNIIKFYGALISEGDLWILMELMDCSLDRFYKLAHSMQPTPPTCIDLTSKAFELSDSHQETVKYETPIPESVLGRISRDILNALSYLYSIKVIHRDIKPSNILINRQGMIKLCDFGISGYLVNSVARTYDAGCRPYMAPERIDPPRDRKGYDIKSDVWSFGITILEIATGRYPYHHARAFFEQLKSICTDPPPRLPADKFSQAFGNFIDLCLKKNFMDRPKYDVLMSHPFIQENKNVNIGHFAMKVISSSDSD